MVTRKFELFGPLWARRRQYHLDKMTLGDLVWAYFLYPAIQIYLVLLGLSLAAAVWLGGSPLRIALAALAVVFFYPLVEYSIHRFLLHAPLYRWRRTAPLWKRVHFDHHRDPNDLRVLFGAPHHQLFAVTAITLPVGAAVGGPPGMAAAFAAGLVCLMFYEFCHCVQHLRFVPRSRYFRYVKRNHLMHHFHNEHGNFGITGYVVDRLVGTRYCNTRQTVHSPTVRNLGYTDEARLRYPWVERLSQEIRTASDPGQCGGGA